MSINNRGKPFTSKFMVFNNVVQAIPNMVSTRVNWQTVVFDLLNEYDEAVLFQFIPLEAGYYYFNTGIYYANLVAGDVFNGTLFLNAVAVKQEYQTRLAVANNYFGFSKMLYVDPTDVVYVETWQNNGLARNFGGNRYYAWFQGWRMG